MKINISISKFVQVDEGSAEVDSLLVITSCDPVKWIKSLKAGTLQDDDTYRVALSLLGIEKGVLRYGHEMEYNKGTVKVTFKTPTILTLSEDSYHQKLDGKAMYELDDFDDIFEVLKTGTCKVVYSSIKDTTLPKNVEDFADVYLATGSNRFDKGTKEYKQQEAALNKLDIPAVKLWYQNQLKTSGEKSPTVVYRGIRVQSSVLDVNYYNDWGKENRPKYAKEVQGNIASWDKTYKQLVKLLGTTDFRKGSRCEYNHYLKLPVSTSTSLKIAKDFCGKYDSYSTVSIGLVLRFDLKPDDIVLDTRLINTDHPTQNEIVLDATHSYKCTIVYSDVIGQL